MRKSISSLVMVVVVGLLGCNTRPDVTTITFSSDMAVLNDSVPESDVVELSGKYNRLILIRASENVHSAESWKRAETEALEKLQDLINSDLYAIVFVRHIYNRNAYLRKVEVYVRDSRAPTPADSSS